MWRRLTRESSKQELPRLSTLDQSIGSGMVGPIDVETRKRFDTACALHIVVIHRVLKRHSLVARAVVDEEGDTRDAGAFGCEQQLGLSVADDGVREGLVPRQVGKGLKEARVGVLCQYGRQAIIARECNRFSSGVVEVLVEEAVELGEDGGFSSDGSDNETRLDTSIEEDQIPREVPRQSTKCSTTNVLVEFRCIGRLDLHCPTRRERTAAEAFKDDLRLLFAWDHLVEVECGADAVYDALA